MICCIISIIRPGGLEHVEGKWFVRCYLRDCVSRQMRSTHIVTLMLLLKVGSLFLRAQVSLLTVRVTWLTLRVRHCMKLSLVRNLVIPPTVLKILVLWLMMAGLTQVSFLAFEVQNTLSYWDGSSWSASTPGSEALTIADVLGTSTTTVTDYSITNPIGLVDQADAEGGVHSHLDFEINLAAASGAYLLELALVGFSDQALTNLIVPASDSFFIVFNYGMDEEIFEAGVDALGVSEVPLPAAWLFLASGLGTLALGRRVKK